MTPDRLLDTAIREFSAKGLEGASTRGIAAAAGTAMSAITYHYGGKEGLYLAAADRIAALMAERSGVLPTCDLAADDPGAARDAAVRLLLRLADMMASSDTDTWSLFIAREQMHPTAAFERLYDGGMGIVLSTLAQLVQAATGAAPPTARIAAATLFGQPLALRCSRATFLRLLEIDRITGNELDAAKARIAANTHAILDRLSAETRDTP